MNCPECNKETPPAVDGRVFVCDQCSAVLQFYKDASEVRFMPGDEFLNLPEPERAKIEAEFTSVRSRLEHGGT